MRVSDDEEKPIPRLTGGDRRGWFPLRGDRDRERERLRLPRGGDDGDLERLPEYDLLL